MDHRKVSKTTLLQEVNMNNLNYQYCVNKRSWMGAFEEYFLRLEKICMENNYLQIEGLQSVELYFCHPIRYQKSNRVMWG